MYGDHNILNALAIIAICHYEGLPVEDIKKLSTFKGVKRRFTEKKVKDKIIIDDYAHHPREIKATIESARKKYPNKSIIAIFQPHTFTRTKIFLQEFADSLNLADDVYLCDIFASAREDAGELTINDLKNLIPKSSILELSNIEILKEHEDCVLVFMGAGDIQKFQKKYEKSLSE